MADGLTKSADVQGRHLLASDGMNLGSVREIFVDLGSGRIAFLIVEPPSLLGGSGKFHPVPWSAVQLDGPDGAFRVNITKDAFKTSPSYDRDQLASASYGWHEQSARFFASPNAL